MIRNFKTLCFLLTAWLTDLLMYVLTYVRTYFMTSITRQWLCSYRLDFFTVQCHFIPRSTFLLTTASPMLASWFYWWFVVHVLNFYNHICAEILLLCFHHPKTYILFLILRVLILEVVCHLSEANSLINW